MVNNYKRQSDRQSWREEDMKNAIEKVATRKVGVNKAATIYKVPKTTLLRRLTIYETNKDLNTILKLQRRKCPRAKRKTEKAKQNLFFDKKGGKPAKVQEGKGKSTKKNIKKKSKLSSEDEKEVRCFYCSHLFSESTEGWVQCPSCSLWAHCSCAGVEDDDEDVRFICERCAFE